MEGTCRLQDTAFDAGVQVVLARRFANIKCPAEKEAGNVHNLSLSPCGTLCLVVVSVDGRIACVGFDTETFSPAFQITVSNRCVGAPAISQCKTHCYLPYGDHFLEVALPGGEVLRKVYDISRAVFVCGSVVVSKSDDGVSVYDEDLTLLRTLSHERCMRLAVSDCGGWVVTSSVKEKNTRLWDVNTGEAVACVPAEGLCQVALSRSASVFAVGEEYSVELYDWSGAALRSVVVDGYNESMQFTPCGKYLVVRVRAICSYEEQLEQYDVATMSCVRVIPDSSGVSFAISPCSRVVVFRSSGDILTRHLYPHNSE